jgi:DNA-directed RNA polymerase subunit RPC12/RpoP
MRVVNKDKQAKSEDKRTSSRAIRHSSLETFETPGKPTRHDQNACPICGARISKTASGGRRKYSCSSCGANLNRDLQCSSCGTNRVWQVKGSAACQGCGAKYQ